MRVLEKAFAEAAHTVSERYVQQRLIPSAIEGRGVLVVPAPFGGEYTVYSATQIPHILKVMEALTTGVSESKIRVIAHLLAAGSGRSSTSTQRSSCAWLWPAG